MRRHARGVALIIALVVVALATILATRVGAQSMLDQRRAATLLAQEQGFEVALGAEAWAIEILRGDYERNSRQVTFDPAQVSRKQIVDVIMGRGYTVKEP